MNKNTCREDGLLLLVDAGDTAQSDPLTFA